MLSRLISSFLGKNHSNGVDKKSNHEWYQGFLEQRLVAEQAIPKYELKEVNIKNLQVVLNRDMLLERLPANAVCAEIGVNEGEFSEKILKLTSPSKLHLIDAWGDPSRYHDGLKLEVNKKFESQIRDGQVVVNVGFSTDVLSDFPDEYFDWVYLDTDHTYSVTAAELNILKKKVKTNGIIAGHDYTIGNWVGDCRYGVIEALHELCVVDNWEFLYLTFETNQFKSFAIRRISEFL